MDRRRSDFFDRKAEITWHGVPVARISRQFFNARELIWDKQVRQRSLPPASPALTARRRQTYFLTVAPGVDAAMLVALCICLDEKEKSGDNR